MSDIPFAEIKAWMFDAALPFWGSAGVDHERGGFREELDLRGRPTAVPFKRTRALCRQVYVFSHASLLGWAPGASLSAQGYEYIAARAWLGPDRGWAKQLRADGGVLDPTPDLYDLAFVLFALAWRFKASSDAEVVGRARATLEFIDRSMRPVSGEGFLHQRPATPPRLQNPHMHLLEACLVAYEATGEEPFRRIAHELVDLFHRRFFDGRTLAEYFTDDWQRAPAADGHVIEPGHHFEWAWILASYQRLFGTNLEPEVRALIAFAERHGVDEQTQVTFNRVRDDGVLLDGGSRTWTNTERIKGHLALFELTGQDPRAAVAGSARLLLDRYLAVAPRGSWMDAFDADGQPIATAVPASTLYHVFLAFAEVLRLEPRLSAVRS